MGIVRDPISVHLMNMPARIKGYTMELDDGGYEIILNSCLSFEQNKITYKHELEHIHQYDFSNYDESADLIEMRTHK